MRTKRVLFLDDCNGFEGRNPLATLLQIPADVTLNDLYNLEKTQIGAYRSGGDWKKIMADGKIEYELISEGRKSMYKSGDSDEIYKLISGNY